MIKVFCQYSIGGFGVYEVDEKTQGKFSHAITNDNMRGYPREAIKFFSISGYKLAYYEVNRLRIITIKNILGLGKNSDGSPIPYSIQFVGDLPSDKSSMDRLCVWMASDINRAQDSLHNILTNENGIGVNISKLNQVINDALNSPIPHDELMEKIHSVKSKLKLLITYGFTTGENGNDYIARPLADALQLSYEKDKDAVCMTVKELSLKKGKYSNLLKIPGKPNRNKKKRFIPLQIIAILLVVCGICLKMNFCTKEGGNAGVQIALMVDSLKKEQSVQLLHYHDSIDQTYYEEGFDKDSLTLRFYFDIFYRLVQSSLTKKNFKIYDGFIKVSIPNDVIEVRIKGIRDGKKIHENRRLAKDSSVIKSMYDRSLYTISRRYKSKKILQQSKEAAASYLYKVLHSKGLDEYKNN